MNISTSCDVFYLLLVFLIIIGLLFIVAYNELKNKSNLREFRKADNIDTLMWFGLLLVLIATFFFRCFH